MKTTLTKRVVSLLAVVALLITMFTGMVFSASAEDTAVETYTMQDNSNLSYDKNGTNKEIFTVTNFGVDTIWKKDVAWTNHTYGGEVYSDAEKYPYGKIVVINRNRWKNNTSTSVGQLGLLTTNTVMDLSNGFTFKAVGQSAEVFDENGVNQTGWDIKVGAYTVSIRTFVGDSTGTVTFMKDGVALTDPVAIVPNADYNFNAVKFTNRTGVVNENVNINVDTKTGEGTVGESVANPFLQWNGLCEPSISYDAATKTLTLALDGVEDIKSSRPETKKYVLNNVEPSEFKAVPVSVTGGILNGLVALYEAELQVVKAVEEKTFTEQDIATRNNRPTLVNSLKDSSVKFYTFDNADAGNYETLTAYSEESAALVDVTKGFNFATPIIVSGGVNPTNNAYKVNFGTFYVEVSYATANKAIVNVCKADGTVIDTKTYTISSNKHHHVSNLKNEGFDYQNVTVSNKITAAMTRFEIGVSGDANGNITVYGGLPYSANFWVVNDLATFTQGAYFPNSEVISTFNATEENVADYTVPVTEVKSQWTGTVIPTPNFTAAVAGSEDDTSSDNTSSDDTSSDVVVENTTNLLPTADASKWTGNVEYILESDLVLSGVTCAKAGSFVIRDNTNVPKQMTTVDTFNLGDNFKVSGTLIGNKFRRADDFYAYAYAQVGDFKFVIGDERDETDANRPKVMYVRAYMGEELVYEERIMQGNTLGLNIFDQVNFNATIDNNAKTVILDYTKGAIGALETINGTGTYTGDYSFDAVTATAAAQNNFVQDSVNVAVAGLSVTKYEAQESVEVTVTVNAKNGREYSYTANSYPTIEGMLAADTEIKGAIQDVPGYNLTGWTTVDGTAVETNVAFTEDITLVPVYTKKLETYQISIDTVVNNYQFNTYVTAVSDNAEFTSWTENSKVVSYAKEYSFFVGCDRTLTSVNSGAVAAQPVLSVNNAWTDGTYDYVLTEWALPEGCTLVAEGVIMTKDASVDLTDKTLADVNGTTIRVASTRLTSSAGQYLLYTNTNANFEAKAYLTYSDGSVENTIYVDPVTVA